MLVALRPDASASKSSYSGAVTEQRRNGFTRSERRLGEVRDAGSCHGLTNLWVRSPCPRLGTKDEVGPHARSRRDPHALGILGPQGLEIEVLCSVIAG